jgi:heptosyltransferase II
MQNTDFERILVRATNWLGDAVMSLPALQALRARNPTARISILARPWVADLYGREPFCDEVIPYEVPRGWAGAGVKWKLARMLAARRFDAAILLPNAFDAAALVWTARIPVRIGYARDGRAWLLSHAIEVPDEFRNGGQQLRVRAGERGEPIVRGPGPRHATRHQRFYYIELLKRAGVIESYSENAESRLSGSAEAAEEGRRLFARENFPSRVIGISPGAAFGSAKRWLPEHFLELGIRLAREWGAAVALFGSPGEAELCERICRRIGKSGVTAANLAGKTTLREFIDRAAACFLYVTNDSGAMHIASALGVPTVAVFGSTDAVATGPAGSRFVVVQKRVECSPCQLRDCPIDHRCMTRISVEEVARAAEELMK